MTTGNPSPMSLADSINRGFNLSAVLALGIAGLTFGSDLFAETDPVDKIDNTLLALVGVIAVAWYFTGRHWAQRTPIPLYFAIAALGVQVLGLSIEIGDPTALGDDIPGMILFVALLVVLALIYSANGRHLASIAPAPGPGSNAGGPPA